MSRWIRVKTRKPVCPRGKDALGKPVLVWPHPYPGHPVAFYGRRATGRPAFYLHGAEVRYVSHWQPLPEPPKGAKP